MMHDDDDDEDELTLTTPAQPADDAEELPPAMRVAIIERARAVREAVEDLAQHIRINDTKLPAVVFVLQADTAKKCYTVTARLEGEAARGAAADAVKRLYPHDQHEDIGSAERLPGVIAASAKTLDVAKAVNAAKGEFKTYVTQTVPRPLRHLVRGVVRNMILLRVYTKVPLEEKCPLRISFYWASRIFNNSHFDKAGVLRFLDKCEEDCGGNLVCLAGVQRDRKTILEDPHAHYVRARAVAPHPLANILTADSAKPKKGRASLPILVAGDLLPAEIVPIQDYIKRERAQRADMARGQLILPHRHIYATTAPMPERKPKEQVKQEAANQAAEVRADEQETA